MSIDYVKKSKVLNNGLYEKYVKVHKAYYQDYSLRKYGVVSGDMLNLQVYQDIEQYNTRENLEDWCECARLYVSKHKKVSRLKKRVMSFLDKGNCIFLTLTFTDNVLATTSDETRRVYVRRFLKEYCHEYVANIDFGKINGREHYHAIVRADNIDNTTWLYGSINFKRVPNCKDDIERLSKYVAKISNHALKVTNKRQCLIYSR